MHSYSRSEAFRKWLKAAKEHEDDEIDPILLAQLREKLGDVRYVTKQQIRQALLETAPSHYIFDQLSAGRQYHQELQRSKEAIQIAIAMKGTVYIPTTEPTMRKDLTDYSVRLPNCKCDLQYSDAVIVSFA